MTRPEGRQLNDMGVNLKALLNALDDAQKDMTPEQRAAMNKRIVRGEEKFTVSPEEASRRRAAVRIADLEGVSTDEGERIRQTLVEASEAMGKPAILNLLDFLGQKELHKEDESKTT